MINDEKCPKLKLNTLLSSLAANECESICRKLEPVQLNYGEEIHDSKKIIFPLSCALALSSTSIDGDNIALAVIGSEGLSGINNFLSDTPLPGLTTVIIPGMAMQVDYDILRHEVGSDSDFTSRLLSYTQYLLLSISQLSHCNQRHNIVQRVSRTILQLRTIVESDRVPVTHEMLAYILGVRREVVTNTTIKLRAEGAISYSRGVIQIQQLSTLTHLSCSCEQLSKTHFENLFHKSLRTQNISLCQQAESAVS